MPPKLFLFCLILLIKFTNLDGVDVEEGKYKEMARSEKFEPNPKDCEGIRKYWMKAKEEWKEKYNMEVPIPIGFRNCFLYNISAGIRDKEKLKQMPPPTLPEQKLGIFMEKFEMEHADNMGMEEYFVGKLNVLLHLVLSWEDKRLAKMDEWGGAIGLANLDWIWTPTLENEPEDSLGCSLASCFIKKVALFLLPNQRVRALYTLRLREECQIDHSNFPTEIAICERQIAIGPTENNLKCQNELEIGLTEEDHAHLAKVSEFSKYAIQIRAGIYDYGVAYLKEAKKSKKWQPEENSIECGPSTSKCLPKENCAKIFDNKMTLKMRIVREKGPISTICLWAISLLAIGAFCIRKGNAKLLAAFGLLFVTMLCLFMASLQFPIHGFPNGQPKILKFYKATFFIAVANLLGIYLLQMLASFQDVIVFPYRWLLMARFLNDLPRNLLTKRQPGERLVEEDRSSTVGHGNGEMVEIEIGNETKSAENGGNKMASDSEMWTLLDKMIALILSLCFLCFFIWTIA